MTQYTRKGCVYRTQPFGYFILTKMEGLLLQIGACVVLLEGSVENTGDDESQDHVGEHIAAVVGKRVEGSVVEGAEKRQGGGLGDSVDGDTGNLVNN